MSTNSLLALERLRLVFDAAAAHRKMTLLQQLAKVRLRSAPSVLRLHEMLCFMRAYPDNASVLAAAQGMLAGFARRADLRTHRVALAESGIAGTAIHYRFFAGQAWWLAERWPRQLRLDRSDADTETRVALAMPSLLTPIERHALIELHKPGYAALHRLRGAKESDAVFLLRRTASMPGNGFTREAFVDAMDASMVLQPGPGTPSRSAAAFAPAPVVFRSTAPSRARPDLRSEIGRAPHTLRRLARPDAEALADLARAAMVTRARSLEAFSFADARDGWLVDDGDGLVIALLGVIPERRHALASCYGGLILRNGVPVGYVQSDIVGRSAALSFNAFETFRGGEAAYLFARWLAALHFVFGCTSFSIEPYQLGKDNDEALDSGAWWFYSKLGFAPRDSKTRALVRAERERVLRRPGHRSSRRTLAQLAQQHLFFDLDTAHPQPLVSLPALGMQCGEALTALAGSDRERAIDDMSDSLLRESGLARWPRLSAQQREAWRRLVPILWLMDRSVWSPAERRAMVDLARAKAGNSERDFVKAFLAHPRLGAARH
ncbi:MAG: hypothetical protein ABIN37_13400 [Burkholderiaceae bacterium]